MIDGGTRPQARARIVLDGVNLATNQPLRLEIFDVPLRASGAIDFLGADFAGIELEGTMTTPPGRTGPYRVEY